MEAVLDMKTHIQVSLSKDRTYDANLGDMLSIDVHNLIPELMEHPARQAWFSVLFDLAGHKVDMLESELQSLNKGDRRYEEVSQKMEMATQQQKLLGDTLQAFNHRKSAILNILGNPSMEKSVLREYHKTISYLGRN